MPSSFPGSKYNFCFCHVMIIELVLKDILGHFSAKHFKSKGKVVDVPSPKQKFGKIDETVSKKYAQKWLRVGYNRTLHLTTADYYIDLFVVAKYIEKTFERFQGHTAVSIGF